MTRFDKMLDKYGLASDLFGISSATTPVAEDKTAVQGAHWIPAAQNVTTVPEAPGMEPAHQDSHAAKTMYNAYTEVDAEGNVTHLTPAAGGIRSHADGINETVTFRNTSRKIGNSYGITFFFNTWSKNCGIN